MNSKTLRTPLLNDGKECTLEPDGAAGKVVSRVVAPIEKLTPG